MAFLYFACIVGGFALLKYAPWLVANSPDTSLIEIKVQATITAVVGVVLFIAYVVALLLPKSSGAWIYHAVMIGIGLTSCCFWPATIPLMIAWIKPETQSWFGRTQPGVLPPPRDPNVPPPPIPSV